MMIPPPGPPVRKLSYEERIYAWARSRPPGSGPPTVLDALAALRDPPRKPIHVPGLPAHETRVALTVKQAMGTERPPPR